jgi:outer membrane protein assembly factor BamB
MFLILIAFLSFYAVSPRASAASESGPSLSRPLKPAWSFSSDEMLGLSPALYGQSLYAPLAGGKIVSIGLPDGNLRWKTDVGGEISATPAADEEGIYVATEVSTNPRVRGAKARGFLRLLSPESGVTVWVRQLEAPVRGSLAVSDGVLYAASREGCLYAVEGKTGEIKWVHQNGSPFNSQPLAAGDLILIADEMGNVLALERSAGQLLWSYRTRPPLRSQPVVRDAIVYIGANEGVHALDLMTGKLLWRARTGGGVLGLVGDESGVVATALDNFVYKYSAADGKKLWKRRLSGRVTARPLVTPDGVLVSPLSGDEALILSPANGKKINSIEVGEDGNTAASPLLSGGLVVLSTRSGLFAYTN